MTGSMRAYARHRAEKGLEGQSLAAVQRAIESGRISKEADGSVDFSKADSSWATKTAPSATNRTARHREAHAKPMRSTAGIVQSKNDNYATAKNDGYTAARALKEGYLAGLAKLEYEKRLGNLLMRDDVKSAWEHRISGAKAKFLPIGDQLAASMANETDPVKCREMIDERIWDALSELSRG